MAIRVVVCRFTCWWLSSSVGSDHLIILYTVATHWCHVEQSATVPYSRHHGYDHVTCFPFGDNDHVIMLRDMHAWMQDNAATSCNNSSSGECCTHNLSPVLSALLTYHNGLAIVHTLHTNLYSVWRNIKQWLVLCWIVCLSRDRNIRLSFRTGSFRSKSRWRENDARSIRAAIIEHELVLICN